MKQFYISLLVCLLITNHSFGQEDAGPRVEQSQFTYHLFLGASYETAVSRLNTLRISGPLAFGYVYEAQWTNGEFYSHSEIYGRLAVKGGFRHYYNLDKRLAQGKRVDKNSGNFIGPVVQLFGPAILKSAYIEVPNSALILGGEWGIQRTYGKRFNFQLSVGPGIGFWDGNMEFAPVGDLTLGFRIGK